jgi:hypothetical protein
MKVYNIKSSRPFVCSTIETDKNLFLRRSDLCATMYWPTEREARLIVELLEKKLKKDTRSNISFEIIEIYIDEHQILREN